MSSSWHEKTREIVALNFWLPDVFLSQSDGIGEEKPLVQAFDNLTSMHRLIDIEKTSNWMRDITYQSASLVPTVLRCQIQKFNVPYKIWK